MCKLLEKKKNKVNFKPRENKMWSKNKTDEPRDLWRVAGIHFENSSQSLQWKGFHNSKRLLHMNCIYMTVARLKVILK